MTLYKIFQNPAGLREAVKQGWSWPAFFFTFIWAFVKKLYAVGAAVLVGGIVLGILSWINANDVSASGASNSAQSFERFCDLGGWVIAIVLGVYGNELRERRLLARGYTLLDNVAASSVEEALSSYEAGISTRLSS